MTKAITKVVKIILNLLLGWILVCIGVGTGIGVRDMLETDPEACAEFEPNGKCDLFGRFVKFCLDGARRLKEKQK